MYVVILPYIMADNFMNVFINIPGKHDIFGGDIRDKGPEGKALYTVRPLSYCDINKIDIAELKEILRTYPEFAGDFLLKFQLTFDLEKVSIQIRLLLFNLFLIRCSY